MYESTSLYLFLLSFPLLFLRSDNDDICFISLLPHYLTPADLSTKCIRIIISRNSLLTSARKTGKTRAE